VNLSEDECRDRLAVARHAVLATIHPRRGVDAVPVVYAVVGSRVVLPVDTVKDKRHRRLRRLDNLARDDRCVLLVEQYHDDWTQLWWVRVHGRASIRPATPQALSALAARYPAYGQAGAIEQTVVLTPTAWYGWRA
jgi:PPOX class probable F420-dependent enzyme